MNMSVLLQKYAFMLVKVIVFSASTQDVDVLAAWIRQWANCTVGGLLIMLHGGDMRKQFSM
jgi:hypothetical protein